MDHKRPAIKKTNDSATFCVQAGEHRPGENAPLAVPIAQASVFVLPSFDDLRKYAQGRSSAYLYTRYANPTTRTAEEKIAALESAGDREFDCLLTASGQAACLITALACCAAGDEIVSMLDVYGGTLHLFEEVFPRLGIRARLLPYNEISRMERYFNRRTRLLWLESPTNPTLRAVDLAGSCASARRRGVFSAVDNTFATPILQKPLALGADAVVHSATKFLGGHSDLTAGAVIARREVITRARTLAIHCGVTPDPFASYLLIRGLKTLEVRVERATRNAAAIVSALARHKKIRRILYPGLPENDGHDLARRQMQAFGMMLTLELRGGERAAERFIDALKLWRLATSLGGVESTVSYPMLSSHAGLTAKQLKRMDVSAGMVRLSVGIEGAQDLIEDLRQALGAI